MAERYFNFRTEFRDIVTRKKVNSFVKRDIEVSHYISQLSALLPLITWDKITIGIDWTSSGYKFRRTKLQ